ncbi:glycosyltransferase [Flagellimonas lutimaris]|nr:glycosyltransferase [Allomuricauda lutimaris]
MLIDLEEKKEVTEPDAEQQYDFLYHNTLSGAKGLNFFLDVAKVLKEYRFVVPYSKSEVRKVIPDLEDLKNVKFLSLTWESGLSLILESCKVVINPSLWSSPVEGALLKSIHHNGCVAVVPSEYSFSAELPSDVLIKLSTSPAEAAQMLKEVLEKEGMTNSYRIKSKSWLDIYMKKVESSLQSFIEEEFI